MQRRNSSYLINVVQGKDESLRDYLTRFNKESLTVKDLELSFALASLTSGLKDNSPFTFSLIKKPAQDMADLLRRAKRYVNVEEVMVARKQKTSWSGHHVEKQKHSRGAQESKEKRKDRLELARDDLRHKLPRREGSPKMGASIPTYKNFAPLLEIRTKILAVEKDKVPIQWPAPMRSQQKRGT
ncbi:hypothetical protein CFOL_v3_06158 [Cephalotus follicularis]|uniref:Uncharacterized protein n=1 Tax=Cephalotus follicularis TaxID=3775 RepID=A0A1Q3B409_CEPFO|nr:hypothetical protein CFOL_v3_06158 [Cephalotus follicularis]